MRWASGVVGIKRSSQLLVVSFKSFRLYCPVIVACLNHIMNPAVHFATGAAMLVYQHTAEILGQCGQFGARKRLRLSAMAKITGRSAGVPDWQCLIFLIFYSVPDGVKRDAARGRLINQMPFRF